MRARFRSWWQKIKKHPYATGVVVFIALIAFIFAAYRFGWSGTGFLNKNLWDWLQLLIIPLALAVVALLFNRATTRTEQQIAARRYHQDREIAAQRYENDQKIALDKQREDLLQAYLDRMAELLLKEKLRSSEADAEVRNVARVRTITVLTQLDGRRIGHVFTFLLEAGLISTTPKDNVVNLREADLGAVNWSHAYLSGAYLPEANLYKADLSEADLSEANLSEAYLIEADLSKAYLWGADLQAAGLNGANLSGANLTDANLSGAFLDGTNFSGATLIGAKLNGTKITEEQLKKAKALDGATMPDGSIHP